MTARIAAGLGNDATRDVRPESFRAKGRSKHSAPGLAVTPLAEASIYRPFGTGAV
jgi:hypothetical protein